MDLVPSSWLKMVSFTMYEHVVWCISYMPSLSSQFLFPLHLLFAALSLSFSLSLSSPPVHTMDELKMTGNCLLGSRPLLSFDRVSVTLIMRELLRHLMLLFGIGPILFILRTRCHSSRLTVLNVEIPRHKAAFLSLEEVEY